MLKSLLGGGPETFTVGLENPSKVGCLWHRTTKRAWRKHFCVVQDGALFLGRDDACRFKVTRVPLRGAAVQMHGEQGGRDRPPYYYFTVSRTREPAFVLHVHCDKPGEMRQWHDAIVSASSKRSPKVQHAARDDERALTFSKAGTVGCLYQRSGRAGETSVQPVFLALRDDGLVFFDTQPEIIAVDRIRLRDGQVANHRSRRDNFAQVTRLNKVESEGHAMDFAMEVRAGGKVEVFSAGSAEQAEDWFRALVLASDTTLTPEAKNRLRLSTYHRK